jgi:hypothetical protein
VALTEQLMSLMDDSHLVTALHCELDPLTSTATERELLRRIECLLEEMDSDLVKAADNFDLTATDITKLGDALIVSAEQTAKLLEVIGDEGYDDPEALKADLLLLSKFRAIANDMGEDAARLFNLITTAQE